VFLNPQHWIPRSMLAAACLAGFASAATLAQDGQPAPAQTLREECFALELEGEPQGLARWRRRDDGLGFELELDVWFTADRVRIHMVEREHPRDAKFVWRELRGQGGRTLVVRRSPDRRKLDILEWGGRECLREEGRAEEPIQFLPGLVELARAGRTGRCMAFDPLGRAVEALECSSVPPSEAICASVSRTGPDAVDSADDPDASEEPDRETVLRRADGTLAGRYCFRGERLVAFTWNEGGVLARAIERAEFERRLADYESGTRED
jgi:hypothetical protein